MSMVQVKPQPKSRNLENLSPSESEQIIQFKHPEKYRTSEWYTGHIRNGMAEIIKMAVTDDPILFELMEQYGARLLETHFANINSDEHLEAIDLIFIDADKGEYVDYFQLILDKGLLTPGGFICVDNTLLQGQPYLPREQRTVNGEAIAQFNNIVADDDRVEQVLLPLRDGLTIIRRR